MSKLTINISELRNHFDGYIDRVKLGEVIVVTKYGKPVAEFAPATAIQKEQKLSKR